MATINDYFIQAELSQAAYGKGLTKGMIGGGSPGATSNYAKALITGGMSEAQAIAFADKYTVDNQIPDTGSGFSGTIFKDASGQKYMAIRGTEGLNPLDWMTNVADIGSDGVAISQGLDMYNWYQEVTGSGL